MHTEMSFDTYKYVKEFIKVGMPEPQAEAIISLIHDSKNYDLSRLATKEQVKLLEQKVDNMATKEQFNLLEQKMATKDDLSRLEIQMSKFEVQMAKQDSGQKTWMLGIFTSILALGVTIMIKLH